MDVLLCTILVSVFILTVLYYRNIYTCRMMHEAVSAISIYLNELVIHNAYILDYDYFDKIMVRYEYYLLNIFAFGKYKAIRPLYRRVIKEVYEKKEK